MMEQEGETSPSTHPWFYTLGSVSRYREIDRQDFSRFDMRRGDYTTEEALKKSWDLLNEHLDATQRHDLLTMGKFQVATQCGASDWIAPPHVWVTADWGHVNVTENIDGMEGKRYCVAPEYGTQIPLWDHILSQVLAIQHNWTYFQGKAIMA